MIIWFGGLVLTNELVIIKQVCDFITLVPRDGKYSYFPTI